MEYGDILLSVVRRFALGSVAQMELVVRLMRLSGELGRREKVDKLVQAGLVDLYTKTDLCTEILLARDYIYKEYFAEDSDI